MDVLYLYGPSEKKCFFYLNPQYICNLSLCTYLPIETLAFEEFFLVESHVGLILSAVWLSLAKPCLYTCLVPD